MGASIVYKMKLGRRRLVWCSPEFARLNPEKYDILVRKMPGSAWKWLPDKDAAVAKAGNPKNQSALLVFVSAEERRNDATIAPIRCKLTGAEMTVWLNEVDDTLSTMGVCHI